MAEFDKRYSNPELAKNYMDRNQENKAILLRVVNLDKKQIFSGGTQESFINNLRNNLQKFSFDKNDPIFKSLMNGEGYMFRCIERRSDGKPVNNERGYEYSTVQDALQYIHEIGYEMDPTEFIQEFCHSSLEPIDTFAGPWLYGSDLSFIMIYRFGLYHTPEDVEMVQWNKENGYEDSKSIVFQNKSFSSKEMLEFPTIRDLLEGILVIKWM